jgi:hypothetical protein
MGGPLSIPSVADSPPSEVVSIGAYAGVGGSTGLPVASELIGLANRR